MISDRIGTMRKQKETYEEDAFDHGLLVTKVVCMFCETQELSVFSVAGIEDWEILEMCDRVGKPCM